MIFDNLSIAGIVIVSLYGLLPLIFREEMIRVEDEDVPCSQAPSPCGPEAMGRPLMAVDDI